MVTTKSRSWSVGPVSGQQRSSGAQPWSGYDLPGVNCSETVTGTTHHMSRGHWSGGGPVFISRDVTSLTPESIRYSKPSGIGNQIVGQVRMGSNLSAGYVMNPYDTLSDTELDAHGTTAISRILPTNPSFDLATLLGELRAEGIPRMPDFVTREKVLRAKSAGDRYLEYEFGWAPLVRGIRDFADTVTRSDDIVRSYQENANIAFSRRYDFPLLEENHAGPMTFGSVPSSGGQWGSGGRHQSRRQEKWFEAEFVYYLPTGTSINDKFRRYGSYARKLYGVDLTPEILWNLAPWSWAADWFANTGDVLHNISNMGVDGLVMRHAYMMCHTSKITSDSAKHNGTGSSCTRVSIVEYKQRRPGTPYGFGLSYEGLSLKQKAIVAALGISKW